MVKYTMKRKTHKPRTRKGPPANLEYRKKKMTHEEIEELVKKFLDKGGKISIISIEGSN